MVSRPERLLRGRTPRSAPRSWFFFDLAVVLALSQLMPALTKLATVRVRQTRGYHHCEVCIRDMGDDAREAIQQGLIARESAEFRVRGHGVVYAVPQLTDPLRGRSRGRIAW